VARLSDKYIAGFLDSDGHIGIRFAQPSPTLRPDIYRAYVIVSFSQKDVYKIVLDKIQQVYGGTLEERIIKNKKYYTLFLMSKYAVPMLAKIGQYLVVHRNYAQYCLSIHKQDFTSEEVQKEKINLKRIKKAPCLPLPKHPTRGWMAGYIDGDGCIDARLNTRSYNSAALRLRIAEMTDYSEGIDLIYKVFGGNKTIQDKREPNLVVWNLALPTSKLLEIYDFCGKHLLLKRDQFTFAKGCAEMGHYRDGRIIKQILSDLKAQPQRLSDSDCDVSHLLCKVKNLRKMWWKQ